MNSHPVPQREQRTSCGDFIPYYHQPTPKEHLNLDNQWQTIKDHPKEQNLNPTHIQCQCPSPITASHSHQPSMTYTWPSKAAREREWLDKDAHKRTTHRQAQTNDSHRSLSVRHTRGLDRTFRWWDWSVSSERERGRRPSSVGQCEWSWWTLGSVLFLPGEHMDCVTWGHGDCTDVVTHVRWQWKGGGEGGAGRRVHQVLWLLWAEYIITHWQCTGYDSYLDNNVTWLFKGIKKTCSKGVGCV